MLNILKNINIILIKAIIANSSLNLNENLRLPILDDIKFYESSKKSKRGNITTTTRYAIYDELPTEIQNELKLIYKKNISEIILENDIIKCIERINRWILNLYKNNDYVLNIHQKSNLTFNKMLFSDFNNIQKMKIHKSPTYNGRQSSEYYVGIFNGFIIYIRKSNHWGNFKTSKFVNINDDYVDYNEIPDNKKYNYHNWVLIDGEKNINGDYKNISQIGYMYISVDMNIRNYLKFKYE